MKAVIELYAVKNKTFPFRGITAYPDRKLRKIGRPGYGATARDEQGQQQEKRRLFHSIFFPAAMGNIIHQTAHLTPVPYDKIGHADDQVKS
ncbi:MAG: hypothetical protein NTY45_12195 [Elusimicrobia bacterium]|nr:hypothetical protein [Elusimicrobiota bacterium]